jgi:hypothetical protein
MDARESNMRRHSVGAAIGSAGVTARDRGEKRPLDGTESSSCVAANGRFVPIVAEGMTAWRAGGRPLSVDISTTW